jgi:hypothetical protein
MKVACRRGAEIIFLAGSGARRVRKLAATRVAAVAGNRVVAWRARVGEVEAVTSCLGSFFGRLGLEPLPCLSSAAAERLHHPVLLPLSASPPTSLGRLHHPLPSRLLLLPPVALSPAAATATSRGSLPCCCWSLSSTPSAEQGKLPCCCSLRWLALLLQMCFGSQPNEIVLDSDFN